MRMYGVGGRLRDALARAWNRLKSPVTGLVFTLTIPLIFIATGHPGLQNPAVFYFGVSLMIASGSTIVAAKVVDRVRRRLETIAGGLSSMSLAFINFAGYYWSLSYSNTTAYIGLAIGVAFLVLGAATLLSIRIKRLEKVLKPKTREIMSDVLEDRLRDYLYVTAAIAVFELAVSIAAAVLFYIADLLNPLVALCVAVLAVQSAAILALMPRYGGRMPYIKFMWFLELLTPAVVLIALSNAVPDFRPSSIAVLALILSALGIASTEAPNWVYLLKKSKMK